MCDLTHCSLDDAIAAANGAAGADTIELNIAPSGATHILLRATELPAITGDLVIDGYTQPGAVKNTIPTSAAPQAAARPSTNLIGGNTLGLAHHVDADVVPLNQRLACRQVRPCAADDGDGVAACPTAAPPSPSAARCRRR